MVKTFLVAVEIGTDDPNVTAQALEEDLSDQWEVQSVKPWSPHDSNPTTPIPVAPNLTT